MECAAQEERERDDVLDSHSRFNLCALQWALTLHTLASGEFAIEDSPSHVFIYEI